MPFLKNLEKKILLVINLQTSHQKIDRLFKDSKKISALKKKVLPEKKKFRMLK
jgi:hypothetical protein